MIRLGKARQGLKGCVRGTGWETRGSGWAGEGVRGTTSLFSMKRTAILLHHDYEDCPRWRMSTHIIFKHSSNFKIQPGLRMAGFKKKSFCCRANYVHCANQRARRHCKGTIEIQIYKLEPTNWFVVMISYVGQYTGDSRKFWGRRKMREIVAKRSARSALAGLILRI